MKDFGPKYYSDMSVWEIAQILHLATNDHLLYFKPKEGEIIELQVEKAKWGKITLTKKNE